MYKRQGLVCIRIFGERFGGRIAIAEDADANQSYDGCDPVAVEVELVERPVTHCRRGHPHLGALDRGGRGRIGGARVRLFDVHRRAVGQLVKQDHRDLVGAERVGEGQQHGIVGGLAGLGGVEGFDPGSELLPPLVRRQADIVGQIIAAPHVGINRVQRPALGRGQHQKGVIEVLGRGTGDGAANRVEMCIRDSRTVGHLEERNGESR